MQLWTGGTHQGSRKRNGRALTSSITYVELSMSNKENRSELFDRIFQDVEDDIVNRRWVDAKVRFPDLPDSELKEQIMNEYNEDWDRWVEQMEIKRKARTEAFGENFEKYVDDLQTLFSKGFNPIKVTTMMIEYTFVFRTEEEANAGYERFEKNRDEKRDPDPVVGWWHDEENFIKAKESYEAEMSELYKEPYHIRVIDIDEELKERILNFKYPELPDLPHPLRRMSHEAQRNNLS